jgi:hypothetical protein
VGRGWRSSAGDSNGGRMGGTGTSNSGGSGGAIDGEITSARRSRCHRKQSKCLHHQIQAHGVPRTDRPAGDGERPVGDVWGHTGRRRCYCHGIQARGDSHGGATDLESPAPGNNEMGMEVPAAAPPPLILEWIGG